MKKTDELPYFLIKTFSPVWEQEYGKPYEISGWDFKEAKVYLELNGGKYNADNITNKAKIYIKLGDYYASEKCRHCFATFILGIGKWVTEKKKELPTIRTGWWTCPDCKERMLESYQASHRCASQPIPSEPPE